MQKVKWHSKEAIIIYLNTYSLYKLLLNIMIHIFSSDAKFHKIYHEKCNTLDDPWNQSQHDYLFQDLHQIKHYVSILLDITRNIIEMLFFRIKIIWSMMSGHRELVCFGGLPKPTFFEITQIQWGFFNLIIESPASMLDKIMLWNEYSKLTNPQAMFQIHNETYL